ncbi:unnamed protein product [Cylicostephanus goldi]|uniref:Uncharacterized protein n=1 Tax=Cylicostephanus goldi TaxID=71465 RepID=A0A3P6T838_CYLGO|nr:unnamed protein product [Cylicostephanus goldi]
MFQKYECTHEALASLPIDGNCENLGLNPTLKALGKSYNFESYRLPKMPDNLDEYYKMAVEDWIYTGTLKDALFSDETKVKFARVS